MFHIKIRINEVIAIRRVINYILGISDAAWALTIGSLKLSAAFLFCAVIILIESGGLSTDTYYLYKIANEMALAPIPLLLFFGLGGIILEDYFQSRSRDR